MRVALRALIMMLLLGGGTEPVLASGGNSFISGMVFQDDNASGIRNSGERGLANVTVTLQINQRNADRQRVSTDRNGAYEFTGLAAGTYILTVELPAGYQSNGPGHFEVRLNGESGTRLADFGLARANISPTSGAATSVPANNVPATSLSRGASPGSPATAPQALMPTAVKPTISQQLAALISIRSATFQLNGRSNHNGQITDFAAEGTVLHPNMLAMRLVVDDRDLDVLVLGPKVFQRPRSEELWRPTDLPTLRSWPGVLLALDLMGLPQLTDQVRQVRAADPTPFDERLLACTEVELGPSTSQQIPPAASSGQLEPQGGLMKLCRSPVDGLLQLAHIQIEVPAGQRDQANPISVDAWLRFNDRNAALTIDEPLAIVQPTAIPAPPRPAAPTSMPAARAQPAATRAGTPPPDPAAREIAVAPLTQPASTSNVEADPDHAAAAARALLALSSAAGPRVVNQPQADSVQLEVPWRGERVDPSGASPTMDGIATLGIILETFGVAASSADLQALAETWQPDPSGGPISLDTFARIAQRASLRSLGPLRGPGGGEWTAELARYYLRRGYPVLALVQSTLLTAPAQPLPSAPLGAELAPRYIVLIGFEGEDLLYHDPSTIDGVARRILGTDLDRAWEGAEPPRQGAAFGFGANVIGLLDLASQPVVAAGTPAPSGAVDAAPLTTDSAVALQATAPAGSAGGIHPALLAFMLILIGGSGFVAIRLLR